MASVTKLSLNDNFCSSPWFHVKINPGGDFVPCRWDAVTLTSDYNIANTSISEYINSLPMQTLRMDLLEGKQIKICDSCKNEDRNHKVSGRSRQLLKSAIDIENFNKTFCASPHFEWFDYSYRNQGLTKNLPVDLQIDLGNACNSGCLMCHPIYSSRLHTDYQKLYKSDPIVFDYTTPKRNWTDDKFLVDKFVDELSTIPNLRYLHLLGGETLYLESFYAICEKLIEKGLAKNISLGTTTNCTVYTPRLEKILQEFKHVHIGLSIEAFHPLNDYIRWPSKLEDVQENIKKFVALRNSSDLQLSLRITPCNLSIGHLDTVFDFMIKHSIIAESCNLLVNPSFLRIEILPHNLLMSALDKINNVIKKHKLIPNYDAYVNRRNESIRNEIVSKTIFEYKDLLENLQPVENPKQERLNLVKFLKGFEELRKNCILDYLPEYEEFLRSHNY